MTAGAMDATERYHRARRLLSVIALGVFALVILSFGTMVQGFVDFRASTTPAAAATSAAVAVGSLLALGFLLTLFLGMLHRFDLMSGRETRRIPAFEGSDEPEDGSDG